MLYAKNNEKKNKKAPTHQTKHTYIYITIPNIKNKLKTNNKQIYIYIIKNNLKNEGNQSHTVKTQKHITQKNIKKHFDIIKIYLSTSLK